MKHLRFVPLVEAHLPAILEIEKHSNGAPWSERSFRNELDHSHSRFLVALDGTDIAGYAGMWLVVDEAHITTIAVSPDYRRQGIARKMMIDLLMEAKEQDMTCSTLEVRSGNKAAIGLYESLGYQLAATRKHYYPDNREDASVMWLFNLNEWEPPKQ